MRDDQGAGPGFYGKLPVLGDFVTRRLPREFVSAWDGWLQSAIAASREELGQDWLDVYLTSPIWRFGLSPGLCGSRAWAGVLMPSVDRVGRYFPLTIAVPVKPAHRLPFLFSHGLDWFGCLEAIALDGLEDQCDIDSFDERLQAMALPRAALDGSASTPRESGGKLAFQCSMSATNDIIAAFVGIGAGLLDQFLPGYSLWSTAGSARVAPSLLACEGLPPVSAYGGLLNGQWDRRGWRIHCRGLPGGSAPRHEPAADESMPVAARPEASIEAAEQVQRAASVPQAAWSGGPWISFGRTEVGSKRRYNEDAILDRPSARIWAVADGMGGHDSGDVASRAVVSALAALEPVMPLESYLQRIGRCLESVNSELRQLALRHSANSIIGSTVVVLIAEGARCGFAWAGDSRLYRLRAGRLLQMTRDHSEDLLDSGDFAVDPDMLSTKSNNVITRAVGADELLELDSDIREVREGDRYLLCSDGLDKEVTPHEIEATLQQYPGCRECADKLMELALARGARDNVSVIVVSAEAAGEADGK